jgi:hypothetical protein
MLERMLFREKMKGGLESITKEPVSHEVSWEEMLDYQLEFWKNILNMGHELTVKRVENQDGKAGGEIVGHCIHVYDQVLDEALYTVDLKFLEHFVGEAFGPYEEMTEAKFAQSKSKMAKILESMIDSVVKWCSTASENHGKGAETNASY